MLFPIRILIDRIEIQGPTKLLIAEDTDSVRNILTLQLNKLGIEADFVENGIEALEALESGEYGILITDLHMPKKDGYSLVEDIRKNEDSSDKHFPVIVLTADVQMAQRDTYLKHGFDECLLKPVSMGQFRRLLVRWGLLNEDEQDSADGDAQDVFNHPDDRPAIDREAMIGLMGAFDENTIEMLKMFVEMTEPQIGEIREALEAQDFEDLKELGHSLKGAARSACAPALGDFASELQDEAEANRTVDEIVSNIEKEFARVKSAVYALKV